MIGVVLGGGRSRRMQGRDKSRLFSRGRRVIEAQLDLLAEVCGRSALVVRKDQIQAFPEVGPGRLIFDLVPDCGPLGGLYSALKNYSDDVLLLACDLPTVNKEILLRIRGSFEEDGGPPRPHIPRNQLGKERGSEPLCALWPGSSLGAAAEAIARARLSMRQFGESLNAHYLDLSASEAKLLRNVNFPQDVGNDRDKLEIK